MTRRNCDVCFSNMTSLWRTTTRVRRGCVSELEKLVLQSSRVAWLNSVRPTLHFNAIHCIPHRFHYLQLLTASLRVQSVQFICQNVCYGVTPNCIELCSKHFVWKYCERIWFYIRVRIFYLTLVSAIISNNGNCSC